MASQHAGLAGTGTAAGCSSWLPSTAPALQLCGPTGSKRADCSALRTHSQVCLAGPTQRKPHSSLLGSLWLLVFSRCRDIRTAAVPRVLPGPPAQALQATRPRALSLAAAAPTLALHAWELHLSPFIRFLSQQSFGNLVLKPAGEGTAAATCASNTTGTGCKDQHQPNHPQR